jgi:deoxyribodipyrimidine photo-lyase
MKVNNLVWLRNDLRLEDNPALFNASQNQAIRVVFIINRKQWKKHHVSDSSIGLRLDLVKNISIQLEKLGIQLDLLECDWFNQIPDLIRDFCIKNKIKHLWFNKETPYDENLRDHQVTELLKACNIQVHTEAYDLIVSQPVYNLSGAPFKVFTAYYKRWLKMLDNQSHQAYPSPIRQSQFVSNDITLLDKYNCDYTKDLWPSSGVDIQLRLQQFCKNKISNYDSNRDFPNTPATSLLSPYLSLGAIGPRQCLQQIKSSYKSDNCQELWLKDPWLRELTWRDFYRQLMIHYPHISKNQDFKSNTTRLPWRKDANGFIAWSEGQTGFPIIDAAMRQLNQTNWMHNRLRMLAASFLTKLLFIDWREGEKHFMQKLIDAEFSANNGGWQWSASTGCDSAPYFRVFNPTLQSEKFDKDGEFIKKFVPELSSLDSKSIHKPSIQQCIDCNYPKPIIDYKSARVRAIELFKTNS